MMDAAPHRTPTHTPSPQPADDAPSHSVGPTIAGEFADATPGLDDPDALRDHAQRQGYLFFPGLLPRENVLALRLDLLNILNQHGLLDPHVHAHNPPDDNGTINTQAVHQLSAEQVGYGGVGVPKHIYQQVQKLESFHALAHEPNMLRMYHTLFGEQPFVHPRHITRLILPSPHIAPTPAHQDYIHIQGTRETWTAWLPIGDVPDTMGGLAIFPGSHQRGIYQGRRVAGAGEWIVDVCDKQPQYLTTRYRAGDVLTFHSLTVHAAIPATDKQHVRLSCDFRYQPESEPINDRSFNVHGNALTWEEVYADWQGHDHLKYYWQKKQLHTTDFDEDIRWQKEAICDHNT